MVGPLTSQAIENFSVNYLFVGTDGFDAQKGFYCSDMMRAEVVKKNESECATANNLNG